MPSRALGDDETIAPTYAATHEYLGLLQCEAGCRSLAPLRREEEFEEIRERIRTRADAIWRTGI